MPTSSKKASWGFNPAHLDTNVRPQDDFYTHANGGWCKANPIPPHESRWGTFMQLRARVDTQVHALLEEVARKRKVAPGSAEQIIRDFYRSGMDMKRRNELGMRPLEPLLKKVSSIRTHADLEKVVADLHRIGVGVFFGSGIDQDSKNTSRYVFHIVQGGISLPDRDYYLKSDAESVRVRTAYRTHVEGLFKLLGYKAADAGAAMETVLRIETALAKASMKKEDLRDPHLTYHKMSPTKLAKAAPGFDWKQYLAREGAKDVKDLVAMQPEFLRAMAKLLTTEELEALKTYVTLHIANDFGSALSQKFGNHIFKFYGTVLTGTQKMKPLWRRVLNNVSAHVGELLGQLYVKKHFSPEAKQKMEQMVDDLFAAYEVRLKNLDWMSPTTKKKALQKLRALNRKIGYPDKWKSFKGLVIKADDYVGNIIRSNEYEHRREMKKLPRPIDRTEWHMFPQTVNAYYSPTMCDIVFPAGILQPPFFDPAADAAVNYGAIGAVIGHEITHGFDDEGSKFDAKGNLKSWWTKDDRARFEKKAGVLRRQFDQYTVADGLHVNGTLTLGENIADLGGAAIALDAYRLFMEREGRTDIGGYTPEQRFFFGFALFERENMRPEAQKMQVLSDPHSPGIYRINGPASNLEDFYAAFAVKKGDRLYRTPAQRAKIW